MISKAAAPKKSRKTLSSEEQSGISAKQRTLYATFASNILAQRKTSRPPIASTSMDMETNEQTIATSKLLESMGFLKPRALIEEDFENILLLPADEPDGMKNAYEALENAKTKLRDLGITPNGKLYLLSNIQQIYSVPIPIPFCLNRVSPVHILEKQWGLLIRLPKLTNLV